MILGVYPVLNKVHLLTSNSKDDEVKTGNCSNLERVCRGLKLDCKIDSVKQPNTKAKLKVL